MTSKTVTIEQVPLFLQFNKYIHKGYRPSGISVLDCLKSIFYLHNESANIWIHLFAVLYLLHNFLSRLMFLQGGYLDSSYFFPSYNSYHLYLLVFSVFLMFLGSCIYHIFMPSARTAATYRTLLLIDQLFVILGMTGSAHSFLIYGSKTRNFFINDVSYLILVAVTASTIFNALKIHDMRTRIRSVGHYVLIRTFLGFFVFFCPEFLGTTGRFWAIGWTSAFSYHTLSFMLLVVGASFNGYRFPECCAPGKFDVLISSHAWWHFFHPGFRILFVSW